MAGKGPTPKDSSTRARRNKDAMGMRIITVTPTEQPRLPTIYHTNDEGQQKRFNWPTVTKRWWKMWGESPLADDFTANDWSELLDTALLHARVWQGEFRFASELRLRVAKFGATPEDRARLRITFALADEVENRIDDRSRQHSQQKPPEDGNDPRQILRSVI